jgi:hypothetical protein
MEYAPCGSCAAKLEFDYGFPSGRTADEMRAHTRCPKCARCNVKAQGSDLVVARADLEVVAEIDTSVDGSRLRHAGERGRATTMCELPVAPPLHRYTRQVWPDDAGADQCEDCWSAVRGQELSGRSSERT